MKRYMIQVQNSAGEWVSAYLCRTKQEAAQKAQRWDGARVVLCVHQPRKVR